MTLLKNIPKVDKVLQLADVRALLAVHPRPVVLKAVRAALAALREEALRGELGPGSLTSPAVSERVLAAFSAESAHSLKRVVNGTGVVIHTNLGRSPLPDMVRQLLSDIAFGYSNLEYDLEKGERGSRYSHVERLLCELTGAEAALVVNNNAAAVLLALASLACGKEAVVSRGELVEIGGSFRIPDVMRQSGALLREVGTTNRTHLQDYRAAVTPDTGLFLKVHTSNFAVVGFTAEVAAAELAEVGRELAIPVMADAGSGNLVNLSALSGCAEPTVQEYVRAGVDVVTFSGDKLLGGPQAGIIVGNKARLEAMKKHPLLRALRIDKLTLAALEGTLRLYRDERQALAEIPTLRMLTASPSGLSLRGKSLLRKLRREIPAEMKLRLMDGFSQVGGGALPLAELPTVLIAVEMENTSPQELEERLRKGDVPVIGRIFKGNFLLDLRTILDSDVPLLIAALKSVAGREAGFGKREE
ncbi:MAG: L-seryl-tRNA(Ser) [Geobacteraceae bacterium]|nr:MAG: L-seryl-tRNA(Ser) [Geobacteraceae bacterium]